MLFRSPEDFSLCHVGEWCEEKGKITPNAPNVLVRADQLRQAGIAADRLDEIVTGVNENG